MKKLIPIYQTKSSSEIILN